MDKPQEILSVLNRETGIQFSGWTALSGGDISQAYRLTSDQGSLFLKMNADFAAEQMFRVEAMGLQALSNTGFIQTPKVIWRGNLGEAEGLLLAFIPSRTPSRNDRFNFGQALAKMHQQSHIAFGWEQDNFIGTLVQSNKANASWPDFYVKERLAPQFQLAFDAQLIKRTAIPSLDRMLQVIQDCCPELQPALLHGDLWGGNYLISETGVPFLIDPAVYYGHAEMDLSMSRLFGGFDAAFYQGYETILPQERGYEERQDLYQLYYLLVHLNLFGKSYYSACHRIIQRYF